MLALFLLSLSVTALGQTWKVQTAHIGKIFVAISFVNNQTGFVAGEDNAAGTNLILRTDDGGNTYSQLTYEKFTFLWESIAMENTTHGVVVGAGFDPISVGMEYTIDGETFMTPARGIELIAETESVKTVKGLPGAFVSAGVFSNTSATVNGVAFTRDGGKTWSQSDCGFGLPYYPSARFGSYPTPTTWYATAGTWPNETTSTTESGFGGKVRVLSEKIHIRNGKLEIQDTRRGGGGGSSSSSRRRRLLQEGEYLGAIAKSTDGGETWKILMRERGLYYFNDIDCPTDTLCWAVAESFDGPGAGSRIFHSSDGGATWVQQFYDNTTGAGMMDVEFVSPTEGWTCGGNMDRWQGTFYHTTDAGQTWTPTVVQGVYPITLSLVTQPVTSDGQLPSMTSKLAPF